MSRKAPFTTQTAKLFISIRKTEKELPSKALVKAYCEDYFNKYAMIEKDVEPAKKVEITNCYYIVGVAKKDKVPIIIHLKNIIKYFNFKDDKGIWVDTWWYDYVKSIQYLIHKTTKHESSEIVTNIEEEDMRIIFDDYLDKQKKKEKVGKHGNKCY